MKPKDNPFAAHRLDSVDYLFDNTGWSEILDKFAILNYRAAIIGDHGSGKTTFLECFNQQLQQQGFTTLPLFVNSSTRKLMPEHWQLISQVDGNTIILFDGADVIPRWMWWVFLWHSRHAKGVLGTSHGRQILPALIRTKTNADLLYRVLSALEIPLTDELQQYSESLLKKNQGNIRDVLRDLYWVYADR